MAIEKSKLSISFGGECLEQVGDWEISGRSATLKVRGTKKGQGSFTIRYDGQDEKSGNITVVAQPTITNFSTPYSCKVGDKVKITLEFDAAPRVEDVSFTIPDGMTEVPGSKKLEGTNVVIEATMDQEGSREVKASYRGDERTGYIQGDAETMRDVDVDHNSIAEGEEASVTVNFNS